MWGGVVHKHAGEVSLYMCKQISKAAEVFSSNFSEMFWRKYKATEIRFLLV